jgi:hypothetical protein
MPTSPSSTLWSPAPAPRRKNTVHNIELFLYSTDSEQALGVSLRDYDMKWDTSLAAEYERVRSERAG